MNRDPTFNLWSEPWMTVERGDGALVAASLEMLLREAPTLRALYDASPLVVVGVQRLLVAIVQDIVRPRTDRDLLDLWRAGAFPGDGLARFGELYAHRFDLFSEAHPFLQSADLPRTPAKRSGAKPVGYLLPEQPTGTGVTHYTHAYDATQTFCARCAAKGLLTLPAFASSGGAGIKPSINGVPPIYVLPGGETLFQQVAASLVIPQHQPPTADTSHDTPWWRHDPVVKKKSEVLRVGYGHSLTFPARRVRLHPEPMDVPCTRCGQVTSRGVRTMDYEMGESRPKTAAFWRDPFAAYRISGGEKAPTPVRPVEGRAVWREYTNLFLPATKSGDHHMRPAVIDQLQAIRRSLPYQSAIPFKTVGLRTDMKMKIFEWEESDFQLPAALVDDVEAATAIRDAIEFATECDRIIKRVFRDHFGGSVKDATLNEPSRRRMSQSYWQELAPHFRRFVGRFDGEADPDTLKRRWAEEVCAHAQRTFKAAIEQLPNDAATLRRRVESEAHCQAALRRHFNKQFLNEGGTHEGG